MEEDFLEELSTEEIQSMMDGILQDNSFDFAGYVEGLVNGSQKVSFLDVMRQLFRGLAQNMFQEKKMIIYLLLIVVVGAVFSNFSKLFQGKQVSQSAFYAVYFLFFAVLAASFSQVSQIAADTMGQMLDFTKVLLPAYFLSMSFSHGSMAAGAYYEFTLAVITLVDFVLVTFALPAVHLYFFLQVANQLSEEDMFSKMAELIRDCLRLAIKTMFGIVMGMNVVQGLIVPVTAQVKNMAVVKAGSAIPGVGNTIGSVTETVLCAATLVKNAVGVTGVVVVFLICAAPVLRMLTSQLLYQGITALVQPVSDKRLLSCLGGTVEAIRLLVYIVGTGGMLFVSSIAIISAMTGN